MNRPVHFEISADDPEKVANFYKGLFGWKIESWAGGGDPYWLVTTGPKDVPGIDGGIMRRQFPQAVINTIEVESLADSITKVAAAGGKSVTEPDEIPGIGKFAYFADPEGNLFGLLQPPPQP
jgi:predicted enzyme related to lactoylglutathione lyase